jgi:hypothetical protein
MERQINVRYSTIKGLIGMGSRRSKESKGNSVSIIVIDIAIKIRE